VQWQQLYESCVFETDFEKLDKLVFETEDAIFLRSRELSGESYISDEVQALRQAAKGLLKSRLRVRMA
jgi:hypothetical protein